MGQKIDLTGQRFGRLVVIKEAGRNKHRRELWFCKCDCGNTHVVVGSCLRRGESTSCGCYRREARTTHGFYYHPVYYMRECMLKRCYNPKYEHYKYYGGRGITVCAEWRNEPESFFEWAEANGWRKGLQIDRFDNDKGYFPDNCRFATRSEQKLNSRLLQTNNTSGFRGVVWNKADEKYMAGVKLYGKRHHLGYFATATEAAKARDAFVTKLGLHTPLNFPKECPAPEQNAKLYSQAFATLW